MGIVANSKYLSYCKKTLNYSGKYMNLFLLGILFANCIILSLILNIDVFQCDSDYYWTIADATIQSGKFNLLNYPDSFRGCLLPLLLLFIKHFFRIWGWRLFSAFMVSVLFGVYLPDLFDFKINNVKDAIKVIFAEIVFLYVWGDLAQYPLSDLPALFFLLSGIYVAVKQVKKIREKDNKEKNYISIIKWLICGMFLYASYNTRVIYHYACLFVVLYIAVVFRKQKQLIVRALVPVIIGAFIISMPQCVINYHNTRSFSPKVNTQSYNNYQVDLKYQQLIWGYSHQRYETYMGNTSKYPNPKVFFDDQTGSVITYQQYLNGDNFRLKYFIKMIIYYPLDMVGIYTRHLVSLITPSWRQAYIDDIYTDKTVLFLLSTFLWIFAALNIFADIENKSIFHEKSKLVLALAIMLPGLLQLLGAPELRFFISVYALLYGYVFMKASYKNVWNYVRPRWIQIFFVVLVITFLWISVFGSTLADNRETVLLINDRFR